MRVTQQGYDIEAWIKEKFKGNNHPNNAIDFQT